PDDIAKMLSTPTAERVWYVRYAFKAGWSVEDIHVRTRIDPWFLHQIREIVEVEDRLRAVRDPHSVDAALLLLAKQHGFSDRQLGQRWHTTDRDVRRLRQVRGVSATFKLVDTCAAEFEAYTLYYYSTYEAPITELTTEAQRHREENTELEKSNEAS